MKKSNLIGDPTRYKINLFNLQNQTQKFWCFLSAPKSNIDSTVYANSNTAINVSTYTGSQKASFTVPLQYKVEVGATNKAVGLNTLIESSDTHDSDLEVEWKASYYQKKDDKTPPTLALSGQTAPAGQLAIVTNSYNKNDEPLNKWYGNMSFGIETETGFIGVSWSPNPTFTYKLEPIVNFYVAVGDYSQNKLANITAISSTSANITQKSFDGNYECTVIYQPDGSWVVKPGYAPPASLNLLSTMVSAHAELISAHKNLVELVNFSNSANINSSSGEKAERESTGIKLNNKGNKKNQVDDEFEFITGSITVGVAIAAGFAYMFASSITLNITRTSADGLTIDFNYNGQAGQQAILDAFAAGQRIFFGS
jgi:hypothetical protein